MLPRLFTKTIFWYMYVAFLFSGYVINHFFHIVTVLKMMYSGKFTLYPMLFFCSAITSTTLQKKYSQSPIFKSDYTIRIWCCCRVTYLWNIYEIAFYRNVNHVYLLAKRQVDWLSHECIRSTVIGRALSLVQCRPSNFQ